MNHRNTDFVALCAWFLRDSSQPAKLDETSLNFPLRRGIQLRSNCSLSFSPHEISSCEHDGKGWQVQLNVLTLLGLDGALPIYLTELILEQPHQGGKALHQFLDLFNRRFWELLFQSYRLGVRPQYGFNNQRAKDLIQVLAHTCSGLSASVEDVDNERDATLARSLMSYCFVLGNGAGERRALQDLLSLAIGYRVHVMQEKNCPVDVSIAAQAHLNTAFSNGYGILGKRVALGRKMIFEVWLNDDDLDSFFPAPQGMKLRRLLQFARAIDAGQTPFFSLHCFVLRPPRPACSLLGRARLGWGMALGGASHHTSLIRFSSLTSIHKVATP